MKMNMNKSVSQLVIAGLLCAIGIVIPIISPIKFQIEPASFTLASHVAIFIAMFVSPVTAVIVSIGTTLGFLLAGFTLPIVLRAFSHIIFAFIGAMWIKKRPNLLHNVRESILFCAVTGLIHGVSEVLIVLPMYFGGSLSASVYNSGFFRYIFLLVGVGTVIHSAVDFELSLLIWKPIVKIKGINEVSIAK